MKFLNNKFTWVFFTLMVVAFIIIKNNKEHFNFLKNIIEKIQSASSEKSADNQEDALKFSSDTLGVDPKKEAPPEKSGEINPDSLETPTEQMDDNVQKLEPSDAKLLTPSEFKYITPKIICPLKSDPLLFVILKVQLNFNGAKLEEEIKYRELDIKGIIQNIVYQVEREELKAEPIRNKIKSALSELLQNGNLTDVIFKDFKIEIRKK